MHQPLRLTPRPRRARPGQLALACRIAPACRPARRSRPTAMASARARRSRRCSKPGCRDFFVSTWAEAEALGPLPEGASLVVLHGVGPDDVEAALASHARPVLNSVEQVARWKEIAPDRPCDVMVDTGMNRLGLRPDEVGAARRARRSTRCTAISPAPTRIIALNAMQLERFRAVAAAVPAQALQPRQFAPASASAAITASTSSGPASRSTAASRGAKPKAISARSRASKREIVQRRTIRAGESCGYGATFVAEARHRGGDPQHRLCRRLSARLLVARERRLPANLRCRCSAGCRWT